MVKKIRCSTKFVNLCLHTVSKKKVQAADFDADAFRQRHKAAADRRKAKAANQKNAEDIIYQIREADDPMETAFELLVPDSGKADTLAGELIRAMMRILYRDYNDGDVFYEGYGIETCADAVAFICDKLPDLESKFEDIAMRNLRDEAYTDALNEIADELLDYIYEDPDFVTTENKEDMFDFDGEKFIEDHEWESKYEIDFDIPDNVQAHIDAGNIDAGDLGHEINNWEYLEDAFVYVNPGGGYVNISELSKEAYDEVENFMYQWLEQYGEDLDNEFGVPGEEDEEYEEEE